MGDIICVTEGVLVSEMSPLDANAILSRTHEYDDDWNNISWDFGVGNVRQEWKLFSAKYIGHIDMTTQAIKEESNLTAMH